MIWEEQQIMEWERRGKAEGIKIGELKAFCGLIKDGLISVEQAADRAHMSVAEFQSRTATLPL